MAWNDQDISRPQPVGVFELPAGFLLIPPGQGHDEIRETLAAGRRPESFPPGLEFYRRALAGDAAGALSLLDGDDLITRLNRFVLEPDEGLLTELRGALEGVLATHLEVIAFSTGLADTPPDAAAADGEFAALAHGARAGAAAEIHDLGTAIEELDAAALAARPASAALAGQFLGTLAEAQADQGGLKKAVTTFQAALDLLEGTNLDRTRAEIHVGCGQAFQEMSEAAPRLMANAVRHYTSALGLIEPEDDPELFATAHANLGLAYLLSPMQEAGEQLRIGVAVQSLRQALEVFGPETHPEKWASTQVNLANALVYMPSTHQADNIVEAVELYEAVLQARGRDSDPLGRARVLANQGNALAHLGVFDHAKAKLHEARSMFEEFEEDESVRSVRSILDEIARQESLARQDR